MNSERYIGLDVHQATISVAVMDSAGKVVMESMFYEAQHRKQQVIHLKRNAAQLGLEIIDVANAA